MEHEEVHSGFETEGFLSSSPQSGGAGDGGAGVPVAALTHRRPRPQKLYRIGDVVEYSGVSRQTIHNYTTMGLLMETKHTAGGHRLYDESVFDRLDQIEEFKRQRMSMRLIREHFANVASRNMQVDA